MMHKNEKRRLLDGAPRDLAAGALAAGQTGPRLRRAGPQAGRNAVSLVEVVASRLDFQTMSVPVFAAVARHFQQMLSRPDFGERRLMLLAGADPGVASKVLRVANAALYAGLNRVGTIEEAVMRLGIGPVVDVVRGAIREEVFAPSDSGLNATMQRLWVHSFCCAVAAKWVATKAGYGALAEEAYLAGLFHDIGKLLLLRVIEDLDHEDELHGIASPSLMEEVFESLHVEVGAHLIQEWGMPDSYGEVVRYHDADSWNQLDPLLAIVRLANLACRVCGVGPRSDPSLLLIATTEAHLLGLKEIALAQLEVVIEDAAKAPMSALK